MAKANDKPRGGFIHNLLAWRWGYKRKSAACDVESKKAIDHVKQTSKEAIERIDRMMDHVQMNGEDHWFLRKSLPPEHRRG